MIMMVMGHPIRLPVSSPVHGAVYITVTVMLLATMLITLLKRKWYGTIIDAYYAAKAEVVWHYSAG